jgi:hypothetical protein
LAPPTLLSDADFIRKFEEIGANALARLLGQNVRWVYKRRAEIEKRNGQKIKSPNELVSRNAILPAHESHPERESLSVDDGYVIIGSDAHYWPGLVSTAHRGFVQFCERLKPVAVIVNGDMLDGASISRHPPIGWEKRPSLIEEIETVKDRLGEITVAAGKAKRYWPLGNHDARFSTRLATMVPEYAKINGTRLVDHFPDWVPCWSVDINRDVMVKHRFKGGLHAPHNNTLWAGRSMVTGHLHSQKVMPLTDLDGTRWGVDAGTMADPHGPQFEYQEDSPRNHREGFVVLRFVDGILLQPQLARVMSPGRIDYCGEIIDV